MSFHACNGARFYDMEERQGEMKEIKFCETTTPWAKS